MRRQGLAGDLQPDGQRQSEQPKSLMSQVLLCHPRHRGYERPSVLQPQREEAPGKRHRLWAEAVPQSDSWGNRLKGGRGQIELLLL